MSNDCKSRDCRQDLRGGASPLNLRVEGGRSAWLVGTTQGPTKTDYSACDVELWGDFGGGSALLQVQRLGAELPDSPMVVRYSGAWFNSFEARIINRSTQVAPIDAPLTAWTLHSWHGAVSSVQPCGFTRWSSRAVAVSSAAATLVAGGDPLRRRALVSIIATTAGDFVLIGESAATVATTGFPVTAVVAAGAGFTNQVPLELAHTGEIWARAFSINPSVPVRIIAERE